MSVYDEVRVERERAHRQVAAHRADAERMLAQGRPVAAMTVRALLDALADREARLAELEGALTWGTTCLNCASLLDRSYADYMRAEQAEARLAAVEALADEWDERAASYHNDHLVPDALALRKRATTLRALLPENRETTP